jgi:hypothetical protein
MRTVTQADIERKRSEIVAHIARVQRRMYECIVNLERRAFRHDMSKTEEPELSGFAALQLRKEEMDYGEATYSAGLEEAKAVITLHYAANDHHPEHYPNGIAGMSLLSALEMLCDWRAASSETRNGSIEKSLRVNVERFGIEPQLAALLWNTACELGWLEKENSDGDARP